MLPFAFSWLDKPPKHLEIDSNHIKVELESAELYCGQEVKGNVSFATAFPMIVDSLSVQLFCHVKCVEVDEKVVIVPGVDSGASHATNEIRTMPRIYEFYKSEQVTLISCSDDCARKMSDIKALPFSMQLPQGDFPSTLSAPSNAGFPNYPSSVRYFLKFIVHGRNDLEIWKKEVDLKITSVTNYKNANVPIKRVEAFPIYSSDIFDCCGVIGRFNLICGINKSVFCVGEAIYLSYGIEASDKDKRFLSKTIILCNYEVIRRVIVMEAVLNEKKQSKSFLMCSSKNSSNKMGKIANKYEEVLSSQSVNMPPVGELNTVRLTVTSKNAPSYLKSYPLRWEYCIRLRLMLMGMCVDYDAAVIVPFVLNSKSEVELAEIPYKIPTKDVPTYYVEEDPKKPIQNSVFRREITVD